MTASRGFLDSAPRNVPQPSRVSDVTNSQAPATAAGSPVDARLDVGTAELPGVLSREAYRIVQEGLTNALKHAGANRADVTVRYGADEVEIEVRDNGNGVGTTDGLGHGLVGVRERVKIYGGEMSAGTSPEGGFVLNTRLPIAEEAR